MCDYFITGYYHPGRTVFKCHNLDLGLSEGRTYPCFLSFSRVSFLLIFPVEVMGMSATTLREWNDGVSECVCACVCMYVCMHMYVHVCTCVYVVCACICVCVYMRDACVCVHLCACVYGCVYVRV